MITKSEKKELIITRINGNQLLQNQEILRTSSHNIGSSQIAVTVSERDFDCPFCII